MHKITVEIIEGDIAVARPVIFDHELSDGAFRMLCIILALVQNRRWNLTQTGIATTMKTSARQVRRWVRELKDAGHLVINQIKGERGRWVTCSWTIYPRGLKRMARDGDIPIFREVSARPRP